MSIKVTAIFSHINNDVIGYNGNLAFTHPVDFGHFKKITKGKTVLGGYKTFDEIFKRNPNGLPGRDMVLYSTRDEVKAYWKNKVTVITDPDEFISNHKGHLVIIGGSSVYNELASYVDEWWITHYDLDMSELKSKVDNSKVSRFKPPVLLGDPVVYYKYDFDHKGRNRSMTISKYKMNDTL